MSVTYGGITDVNLSANDVLEVVRKTYSPDACFEKISATSIETGKIGYIVLPDATSPERPRWLQVGLDGVYACDDRLKTGLPDSHSTRTSFSLGDGGDARNIIAAILSATGGYAYDDEGKVTRVERTSNVLDLSEDALNHRRATVWAERTADKMSGLDNLDEGEKGWFVGRLRDTYLSVAKRLHPAAPAAEENEPEFERPSFR